MQLRKGSSGRGLMLAARHLANGALAGMIGLAAATLLPAQAPVMTTLYTFTVGSAGWDPVGNLVRDANGALYGVTSGGGGVSPFCTDGCGVVFQLAPPAVSGGAWTYNVLYSFQGESDGAGPNGPLVFDAQGNLYGTTEGGGAVVNEAYTGTVFELTPPTVPGDPWTHTILATFPTVAEGTAPAGSVVFGADGALYGFTSQGGAFADSDLGGVAFQLTPPAGAGAWNYNVLHSFEPNVDGYSPTGAPVFDKHGRLYGVTAGSLSETAYGQLFVLTPPATAGDAWGEHLLYGIPNSVSGVVFGPDGSLYGTTEHGGINCDEGCGTVVQFQPPASAGGAWTQNVIYEFAGGHDGQLPFNPPVVGPSGKVYGTTDAGGSANAGTIYGLTPPSTPGGAWTKLLLHTFEGTDGRFPLSGIILAPGGVIYGTTNRGGGAGVGVVFELSL
ncbi:MAG TPA: choice-of-anchor tandem repeat GloVer-containing protein [Bryobacteraceae bacterium]|nr:choice-of-anchor tandem repeat GloVer-containing protein [Bryobacteraceae bacterium]